MDDWDDMANIWNRNWDYMEVEPTPSGGGTKRGRSRSRTPATRKRADRAPSRARRMQPRKLTFSSVRTRSRSRSASEPRKKSSKSLSVKPLTRTLLKTRKVRHNLTRKMPRYSRRRTTTRRKTSRRPRGAYRGAIMPKWAKGETKHILSHDNTTLAGVASQSATTPVNGIAAHSGHTLLKLGDLKAWTLNPVVQGNGSDQRNGRHVDGTYLRIQGHIHNTLPREDTSAGANDGGRAYVRMLVLAIKGQSAVSGTGAPTTANSVASFFKDNMFKKINGEVVGFDETTTANSGAGSKRVRSLQLPINRAAYTVLADMKHELSGIDEGFGASDRLFDKKIKLKQRTTWSDEHSSSFEKNQLVLVMYTVDPKMRDAKIGTVVGGVITSGVGIEFESKYSYKDF